MANGNNAVLLIQLSGNLLPPNVGGIALVGGGITMRGLVINRFDNSGFSGGWGVGLAGSGNNNIVEGNFIGTDPTGTIDMGNGNWGILMFDSSSFNTIGGTTPAARNIISGNDLVGIQMSLSLIHISEPTRPY